MFEGTDGTDAEVARQACTFYLAAATNTMTTSQSAVSPTRSTPRHNFKRALVKFLTCCIISSSFISPDQAPEASDLHPVPFLMRF